MLARLCSLLESSSDVYNRQRLMMMTGEDNKEDKMFNWELKCWLRPKDSHLNSMGLQTENSLHPGIHGFAAQVRMRPEDWWTTWLGCLEDVSGSNTLPKMSVTCKRTLAAEAVIRPQVTVSCSQELEQACRGMVGSGTIENPFTNPKKDMCKDSQPWQSKRLRSSFHQRLEDWSKNWWHNG